jgi:hypothetical protein
MNVSHFRVFRAVSMPFLLVNLKSKAGFNAILVFLARLVGTVPHSGGSNFQILSVIRYSACSIYLP